MILCFCEQTGCEKDNPAYRDSLPALSLSHSAPTLESISVFEPEIQNSKMNNDVHPSSIQVSPSPCLVGTHFILGSISGTGASWEKETGFCLHDDYILGGREINRCKLQHRSTSGEGKENRTGVTDKEGETGTGVRHLEWVVKESRSEEGTSALYADEKSC